MSNDELAYQSLTSIAAQIRERKLSPVEVVDDSIARIERLNPALNAVILEGFGEAPRACAPCRRTGHVRQAPGAAAWRARADEGLPGFQDGVAQYLRRCAPLTRLCCRLLHDLFRSESRMPAGSSSARPTRPCSASAVPATITYSVPRTIPSICREIPAAPPAAARQRWQRGLFHGRRGRRWRVHSNSRRLVRGGWLQAVLWPSAAAPRAQFVRRHSPVSRSKGRSPARWPMPPWRSMYWPAAAPATRNSYDTTEDFVAATGRFDQGDAYRVQSQFSASIRSSRRWTSW